MTPICLYVLNLVSHVQQKLVLPFFPPAPQNNNNNNKQTKQQQQTNKKTHQETDLENTVQKVKDKRIRPGGTERKTEKRKKERN